MQLDKIREKKEDSKENWDFDMSIYEREEEKTSALTSIKNANKPRITNLRSKYSPSQMDLENLSNIKIKISQYAIKVASRTQDISDLWDLYGCINEYWARIHDIFGSTIINEVKNMEKICVRALVKYSTGSVIPYKLHKYLLAFRNKIYMIAQRSNLGLEVEKVSYTSIAQSVRGIKE